jgi:alanine racemase
MTTYVAVDYEAIKHNLGQVRSKLAAGAKLMAVVKANAYGHGLVPTATACVEAGADMLGVSSITEGVALRTAGVTAPVLVFLPLLEEEAALAVAHKLTATVTNEGQLTALRWAAERAARTADFHIFIDSGLGRPSAGDDLAKLMRLAGHWPVVRLEGVYTHFDSTRPQIDQTTLVDVLKPGTELRMLASMIRTMARQEVGGELMVHAAASAAFLSGEGTHLDMVRIGTLLYGQWPQHVSEKSLDLRPTFELRTHIIALGELPARSRVGYGGEFVCRRKTRVATLPVGFAHGLGIAPTSLASTFRKWLKAHMKGSLQVRIGSAEAPIIGRISMDQCAVDVTDVPTAKVGSEVVLPVRRLSVSAEIPRVATDLRQT